MDWNQSIMHEQRVRFILEVQQRTFSFGVRRRSAQDRGIPWWTRSRGGIRAP